MMTAISPYVIFVHKTMFLTTFQEQRELVVVLDFFSFSFLFHTSSLTTRIVVVYRPPPSSINGLTSSLFFTEFYSFLESMVPSPGKLLIVGDFNFAVNNGNDGAALNFLDLLNTFNLTQHIKVPTHKDNNTLDLIITREDELTATNFSVHDPVISDHLALHCNLHVDKPPNIKKRINY